MKKLDEIIKKFDNKSFEKHEEWVSFSHPDNKDVTLNLDITKDGEQEMIDEIELNNFLLYKYITGQIIIKENYLEALVDFSNIFDYYDEKSTNIVASGPDYAEKAHYELGAISEEFDPFLTESIHWDNFSTEYFKSIKLNNLSNLIKDDYKSDEFLNKAKDLISIIFYQLSTRHGLRLKLIDLSDYDQFEPDIEEVDTSEIENTIIETSNYDLDLVNYYNRAIQMTNSSFKYLAYFQILECIFDEVYRDETIQDAKSIINSNWFDSRNSDNILELIKVIDRFSKDQNDRSKVKLILEKYFKMNLHNEAYLLAYSDISDKLIQLKLINSENDLKDLQKLGNIIYDIRCEYTHSNRSFPKKKETNVESEKLNEHIELIRLISKVIIENYQKK